MQLPHVTSFIGGLSIARGDDPMPVIGPAAGEPVAMLHQADAGEVGLAVASARDAWQNWRNVSVAARQTMLRRLADMIEANLDILAELETRTMGLPIRQTRMMADRAAGIYRFFAEFAGQHPEEMYRQERGYTTLVAREPVGVVGLISPWNAPLLLSSMKIAGALAFGNTCVLKPSEQTPLSLQRLMELITASDIPPGVVNMVNGTGPVTGKALIEHAGIDVISFTGGTATGRTVMAAAAQRLRPVATELGGKSANIVFADADFERALDGTLFAAFANNGEACLAGSRILIQRSIADRFLAAFIDRTKAIRVGDPMNPATEMGPVISAAHKARILAYLDQAQHSGCKVLTGGGDAGQAKGFYLDPIAVLAPSNRLPVCQDEIFGPFVTVTLFDTEDEAFAIANDSPFGLASYLWTGNLGTAMRGMRAIRAGTTWVNTPLLRDLRAGFGGFGDSGVGRESGRGSLQMFTQEKATIIGDGTGFIPRMGVSA
ncbi:aldehyde dehydrogenase [Sphingomonas crocodyli]|uniref:Aldehyde dehydrogenase n=1 Tax=Sphingomonas crocodyli TaxID=1979270 RepID=A0A437LZW6_9SPHN|nr:aldehyde dehydrogenase [Sphingomonas crocodyli]RVT90971.1 aldehyde dehydrogenase [Sphingomonas crocodyli]